MTRRDAVPGLVILAVFAILAPAPLVVDDYVLSVLINIATYTALATAWAFFSGVTRYVSLAASAFFGVGTYSVAVLGEQSYLLALAVAAAIGAVLSLVVGLATLRLKGMYFVIFTFGLSGLIHEVVNWWEFNITETMGRYVFLDIGGDVIYLQLLTAATAITLLWWKRDHGRMGFALGTIGSDETVARQIGIDTTRIKLATFVASSVIMTLVGAILAPRWSYIDPTIAFNPNISFLTVVMALLGGARRYWGPVMGVVPLAVLSDYLSVTVPDYFSIALGACFLAVVFFIPEGIAIRLETAYMRSRQRVRTSLERRRA